MSNDRFHFPRKQRSGIIALVIIIIALLLSWRVIRSVRPPRVESITSLPAPDNVLQNSSPSSSDEEEITSIATDTKLSQIGPFDPNMASEEQLIAAGLPVRTARTLIKYRSKGGKFRKKEDLLKLYTMTREDYNRIEHYVRIPAQQLSQQGPVRQNTKAVNIPDIIDLNKADANTLMMLKGIGPGYAKRILEYRDKLGGFFKIEQIAEVYGFPDSTYQQLKSTFAVNPADIRKLNINTADEASLAMHPYIKKYMAANIIKLRNDLKKFSKIEDLRQVSLINEEKYRKIAPYLSLE